MLVALAEPERCAQAVIDAVGKTSLGAFGVRVHGAGEYPERLRDAKHPVELLYFQGHWPLTETRCVSVVGTREASAERLQRGRAIARKLGRKVFILNSCFERGLTWPDRLQRKGAIRVRELDDILGVLNAEAH